MEIQYAISLGILAAAVLSIVLVVKLSARQRVGHNLINLAIGCVVLSIVALVISACLSGNRTDIFKLSAPVTILVIVLAVRKRKKREAGQ